MFAELGEQTLHAHPEHQCYYILQGSGCMCIDGEEKHSQTGDATVGIHGFGASIFDPGNPTSADITESLAGMKRISS